MKHREGVGLCQVKKRLSMSRQEKNEGGIYTKHVSIECRLLLHKL